MEIVLTVLIAFNFVTNAAKTDKIVSTASLVIFYKAINVKSAILKYHIVTIATTMEHHAFPVILTIN